MPRLFVGLELPGQVKRQIMELEDRAVAGARWQLARQLHLTLHFIGQVESSRVAGIRESLRSLTGGALTLALQGVGCFGPPHNPRSLWVGLEPRAPLLALHAQVNQRLAGVGYKSEAAAFKPHITVARCRRKAGSAQEWLTAHAGLTSAAFTVDCVSLFVSRLEPGGSRYRVMARFPLGALPTARQQGQACYGKQ